MFRVTLYRPGRSLFGGEAHDCLGVRSGAVAVMTNCLQNKLGERRRDAVPGADKSGSCRPPELPLQGAV